MKWLCEHVAANSNRFNIGDDGCTPYKRLHGKRDTGHVLQFGEKTHYFTTARNRAKLDRRWRDGMYLGTSLMSNEHFIADENGGIKRARGIARATKEIRWDRSWAQRITGTPMELNANTVIEECENPHHAKDRAEREARDHDSPEPEHPNVDADEHPPPQLPDIVRYRITKHDCIKHGYSLDLGCRRCTELNNGNAQTSENHSEACRKRFYTCFVDTNDARFAEWRRTSKEFAQERERGIQEAVPGPSRPLVPEVLDDSIPYEDDDDGDDVDPGTLVDLRVQLGATPVDASNAILNMTRTLKPTTFYEIYGRGELTRHAQESRRNLNVHGIRVLDLRTTMPDGTLWDLSL